MISTAGTPAITSMPITSALPIWLRHLPSARSATSRAMPMTTASLANSDGWIDIPPSCSQDRDPLIVEPMISTSSSPMIDAR